MRSFVAALLVCLLGTSLAPSISAEETASSRDGVFIHLSSGTDDPHRVLMALSMASIMAADREVLIYCDIDGIEICLADADNLAYAQFTPLHKALASLLDQGVTIMACPGCLKAAGKTPDDLAEGIEVADKSRFFSFTNGRILTLDY